MEVSGDIVQASGCNSRSESENNYVPGTIVDLPHRTSMPRMHGDVTDLPPEFYSWKLDIL